MSLPFPSVGATENAMLAACGAAGLTRICNAAREPEIVDLQGFLQALGARVTGAGTEEIHVSGGLPLHPGTYRVMPDRIVTATYLCAVASAGGQGVLQGARGDHVEPVTAALSAAGCRVRGIPEGLQIARDGPLRGIGALQTGPYPAFPTDAQPLLAAALAGGTGRRPSPRRSLTTAFATPRAWRRWGRRCGRRGRPCISPAIPCTAEAWRPPTCGAAQP
ncbi:MAG: hypothetical protein ACLUNZ_10850 [Evtepia sp.]